MTVIYGIPNCDKCRAARKWFTAQGIEHRFHDVRADGLEANRVAEWIAELGHEQLLNRRSTTWRQLNDAERSRAEGDECVALLLEHPALLKRPLVDTGTALLVGYDEAAWRAAIT